MNQRRLGLGECMAVLLHVSLTRRWTGVWRGRTHSGPRYKLPCVSFEGPRWIITNSSSPGIKEIPALIQGFIPVVSSDFLPLETYSHLTIVTHNRLALQIVHLIYCRESPTFSIPIYRRVQHTRLETLLHLYR